MSVRFIGLVGAALFAVSMTCGGLAHAQARKPNILIIWGDD